MIVAGFLLVATLVTGAILMLIALQAYKLFGAINTRFAKQQAMIVVLICGAGLVRSIQDIGMHAIRLGWLPLSTGGRLVSVLQAIIVLFGLAVLAPALIILRQLTSEFARTEVIADRFAGRLPKGVTTETAGLTKREVEVVEVVGSGLVSDREIADELTISTATAATHIRNIMRKTGVKRRADLTLLASRERPHAKG